MSRGGRLLSTSLCGDDLGVCSYPGVTLNRDALGYTLYNASNRTVLFNTGNGSRGDVEILEQGFPLTLGLSKLIF